MGYAHCEQIRGLRIYASNSQCDSLKSRASELQKQTPANMPSSMRTTKTPPLTTPSAINLLFSLMSSKKPLLLLFMLFLGGFICPSSCAKVAAVTNSIEKSLQENLSTLQHTTTPLPGVGPAPPAPVDSVINAGAINQENPHSAITTTEEATIELTTTTPIITTTTMPSITTTTERDVIIMDDNDTAAITAVTHTCMENCKSESHLFYSEYGANCENNSTADFCFHTRCNSGCDLWWRALTEQTPCRRACLTELSFVTDLPCIAACETAQRAYWRSQREKMAPLLAAAPIDFKKGLLSWHVRLPKMYLAQYGFHAQYQRVGNNASDSKTPWQRMFFYKCAEQFECTILEILQPFTSYRFRFELPFGDGVDDCLYSMPSEVFRTNEFGEPMSKPKVEHVYALDEQHIGIFWEPGDFINGPLTGYQLNVTGGKLNHTQLLSAEAKSHIVNGLSPGENYTFELAMVNKEGAGPVASVSCLTPPAANTKHYFEGVNTLIIAGEYSIKLKSLDSGAEHVMLFTHESLISDFTVVASSRMLFVLDVMGKGFSIPIKSPMDLTAFSFQSRFNGFNAHKISADWLNERLYIAGERSQIWSIISTDLYGNEVEVVVKHRKTPIDQLCIDPVNGFLFWLQNGFLMRFNLESNHTAQLYTPSPVSFFTNDYTRSLLYAYSPSDSEFYEIGYSGNYSQSLSLKGSPGWHGEVLSFWHIGDTFLSVNGTHVAHFSDHRGEHALHQLWPINELEWCFHIFPLLQNYPAQPLPVPHSPPGQLHAVLGAHQAQIRWNAPQLNPFQTSHAWQQWLYELEIMDVASYSSFNIRSIKTTHFKVEKLQSNSEYELRVRASSEMGLSEWSEKLQVRTWPLEETRFLLAARDGIFAVDSLYAANATKGKLERVAGIMEPVQDFVQLNDTLFYITAAGRLSCAHMLTPSLECGFQASNAVSVAYEWRGVKLYWADIKRNCVLRSNLDGSERELLSVFGAQQIWLDSHNGHLYYTDGVRLMRRMLSGMHDTTEMEYYDGKGVSATVRGFAVDIFRKSIYWVVRQSTGQLILCHADVRTDAQKTVLLAIEQDIEFGSFRYINAVDSFVWIERNSSRVVLVRSTALEQAMTMELTRLPQITKAHLRVASVRAMDASVYPSTIDSESIRLDDGYGDEISIKWDPSGTVDNYTVFYKVLVQYGQKILSNIEVTAPNVRLGAPHPPPLSLNVSVTPYTYWRMGSTARAELHMSVNTPAKPKRLRIFVELFEAPLQQQPNISALVRWDASPDVDYGYKVYCWQGKEQIAEQWHNASDARLEAKFEKMQSGETYAFQVESFAPGRVQATEKSPLHELNVDAEAYALPRVLYSTPELIAELDMDLNRERVLVHTASAVEHLVVIHGEQRLLWVSENVELLSYVPGSKPVKLARMRAEVLALTVDWIQRVVYWAERKTIAPKRVSMYALHLCQFKGRIMTPELLFTTESELTLRDLMVLPYAKVLLWLQLGAGMSEAKLTGRNLSDFSELEFPEIVLKQPMERLFPGYLTGERETVNLLDADGKLYEYDAQRGQLNALKIYFSGVPQQLRQVDRDAGYMYTLNNKTVSAYNRRKHTIEFQSYVKDVTHMRAYNYQQYPEKRCLLPHAEVELRQNKTLLNPRVLSMNESSMRLSFVALSSLLGCSVDTPGVEYTLMYGLELSDATSETHFRNVSTYERELSLKDLQPFSNYTLQLFIASYYQHRHKLPLLQSARITVNTAIGIPTEPQNVTAMPLSPHEILVSWLPPLQKNAEAVWYEVRWTNDSDVYLRAENLSITLHNLTAACEYTIELRVCSSAEKFSIAPEVTVRTYKEPPPLTLIKTTPYSLTLESFWPIEGASKVQLVAESKRDSENGKIILEFQQTNDNITVSNLIPKTSYELYLRIYYNNSSALFIWPTANVRPYIFETLADAPSAPGRPEIEHITGEIFKVFWMPARDNGARIIEYSLEALQARSPKRIRRAPSADVSRSVSSANTTTPKSTQLLYNEALYAEEARPLEDIWIVYCNTTENSCIVRDLHSRHLLMFRVRARNEPYGWGPYSADSERVSEPFVSPEKRNSLVLAIIIPAAVVSSCVVVIVILRMVHLRRMKAKKLMEKSRPSIWSNVSTLQQQQIMAGRHRTFSTMSDATLYTGGPLSDADIALLPHIDSSCIALVNFLGSGAFGEVYEGLLRTEEGAQPERVAVKTLRKGASEFSELLQEAQLMSNFQHENIVRLIAICFDSESVSIIMEHMEGGDLLTYLRESRTSTNSKYPPLQPLDLMGMCIDVATGCSYLEDMHFVHRDLACRNCLVSSREPSRRVVKIGDFGLARDIYKSDYYRKEGEGLLPVRWMAPESLIDGVFTTQTDVWSFGVLCWEILTLGQQPYAARTNMEVLNFVQEGGRLQQPDNCPAALFELLLLCWQSNPDERPSFRMCLNTLLSIKTAVRQINMGYDKDDEDIPLYVNNTGIIMSSFLGTPLAKVDEEDVSQMEEEKERSLKEGKELQSMEVQLGAKHHDVETSTTSGSVWCDSDFQENELQQNVYSNVGVSRF